MASFKLRVTGMTCGHCQATVEDALKGVPGTFGAAVFLEQGEAEVDYDEQRANTDKYIAAVQAVGYNASVAE